MKKVFAVLAVIMIVFLCACSRNGSGEINAPDSAPVTTRSLTVRVTFPEGSTVSEIAAKLEKIEVCSAADFMAAANDTALLANYDFGSGITNAAKRAFLFEGYVYPDTYDFYYGESATTAIKRFLSNADNKISQEYAARAKQLGYTMDEIMTIASVIQEESTTAQMSRVSSVLHNRLSESMQLQCDVSIAYLKNSVIPYFQGDVNRYNEDYNTYKCAALPAGPICNPGIDAIKAALYPEDTNYLFFVTDKTDTSVFYYAETYEKHLDNCEKAGW